MRISDWSSDWCSSDLRAQFDIAVLAPDAVEQLPAREDAARMLHEMAEQAEFGRPHRDDLARPHHLVRDRIEFDVGIAQHLAGDRKSVVEGKRVSGRVVLGGRRIIKKKKSLLNT